MSRLKPALEQIEFARGYALRVLDSIPHDLWFEFPPGSPSHVGWQAGHLAIAQYRLGIERIRGKRETDERFFPVRYLELFGKDSVPSQNGGQYPRPAEILSVMQGIHEKLLEELPQLADADFDLPPHPEHPLAKTRLACLQWCSQHEMLHAGQLGLIRRMLGFKPLW